MRADMNDISNNWLLANYLKNGPNAPWEGCALGPNVVAGRHDFRSLPVEEDPFPGLQPGWSKGMADSEGLREKLDRWTINRMSSAVTEKVFASRWKGFKVEETDHTVRCDRGYLGEFASTLFQAHGSGPGIQKSQAWIDAEMQFWREAFGCQTAAGFMKLLESPKIRKATRSIPAKERLIATNRDELLAGRLPTATKGDKLPARGWLTATNGHEWMSFRRVLENLKNEAGTWPAKRTFDAVWASVGPGTKAWTEKEVGLLGGSTSAKGRHTPKTL